MGGRGTSGENHWATSAPAACVLPRGPAHPALGPCHTVLKVGSVYNDTAHRSIIYKSEQELGIRRRGYQQGTK